MVCNLKLFRDLFFHSSDSKKTFKIGEHSKKGDEKGLVGIHDKVDVALKKERKILNMIYNWVS